MSPQQCRATNNSKPLFQHKHRGVSEFALIWELGETEEMSMQDHEKPGGKSSRKKQKRSKKAEQAQSPVPDQQQAAKELIDAAIASTEAPPPVAVATADPSPAEPPPVVEAPPVAEAASAKAPPVAGAAPSTETPPADAAKPETAAPVGLQTIATAYRDYTRKSIADAQSYVEKLSGVRSIDKAMEVQTEFAKQAYETFAADSRKIRELYGELFKQTLKLPMSPFDRPRGR
jgi:hypothetical protein